MHCRSRLQCTASDGFAEFPEARRSRSGLGGAQLYGFPIVSITRTVTLLYNMSRLDLKPPPG